MTQDIAQRIAVLADELEEHLYRYHVLAAPTISDQEFDRLLAELQALEEAHPALVRPDSPTQRVGGAPTSDFPTVRHARPMLSLDNSYSRQDVEDFDRRVRQSLPDEAVEYVFELKIDGVALSLVYQDSLLVRAITRGDGVQGDEITANARTIPTIPLRLRQPGIDCEIRGEVYMESSDFAPAQRPAHSRRRAALRQSAQLHGRFAQAAKPQPSGQAQPALFRLLDTRGRWRPDAPQRVPCNTPRLGPDGP